MNDATENSTIAEMSLQDLAPVIQAQKPFEPRNQYETLINPFVRTQKELCDYAATATEKYETDEYQNLGTSFVEDFLYWDESHFKLLQKATALRLRDILIDNGVEVRKEQRLPVYKALHEYVKTQFEAMPREQKGQVNDYNTRNPPESYEIRSKESEAKHRSNLEHEANSHRTNIGRGSSSRGRPSDISKLFRKDLRYSGASREPIRRLWEAFMDACELCNIDTTDTTSMLRLIQTSFVTGHAFRYFMDHVRPIAKSIEDAIERLENHFLSNRAKRVNDEIWNELSFQFIKQKREFEKLPKTNEICLNDLLAQIGDLADMRTGPGDEAVITAKTIAAVRDIDTFSIVCQNPPEKLQDLNAILRSCALEADRL
eukprot:IDg22068t1